MKVTVTDWCVVQQIDMNVGRVGLVKMLRLTSENAVGMTADRFEIGAAIFRKATQTPEKPREDSLKHAEMLMPVSWIHNEVFIGLLNEHF